MVHQQEPKCRANRLVGCLPGQGHVEDSVQSKQDCLPVRWYTISIQSVLRKDWIAVFKASSTAKVENFSECSPWYNRNGWVGVKHQVTYFACLLTECTSRTIIIVRIAEPFVTTLVSFFLSFFLLLLLSFFLLLRSGMTLCSAQDVNMWLSSSHSSLVVHILP